MNNSPEAIRKASQRIDILARLGQIRGWQETEEVGRKSVHWVGWFRRKATSGKIKIT